MLARCRVHEVSQEWGCEWGSSYMNESIHSVSSHDCRFHSSRMQWPSLLITQKNNQKGNICCYLIISERTTALLGRLSGPTECYWEEL